MGWTCRDCLCPVVLTRGTDQMPMSTKFEMRSDAGVIHNYGRMLVELSATIPDGIVCFFVSYLYMDQIVAKWHDMGILQVTTACCFLHLETTCPNRHKAATLPFCLKHEMCQLKWGKERGGVGGPAHALQYFRMFGSLAYSFDSLCSLEHDDSETIWPEPPSSLQESCYGFGQL